MDEFKYFNYNDLLLNFSNEEEAIKKILKMYLENSNKVIIEHRKKGPHN